MIKKLQKVWCIKKFLIFYKSEFGVDIINKIERMPDKYTQKTTFQVWATENPIKQQYEPN